MPELKPLNITGTLPWKDRALCIRCVFWVLCFCYNRASPHYTLQVKSLDHCEFFEDAEKALRGQP